MLKNIIVSSQNMQIYRKHKYIHASKYQKQKNMAFNHKHKIILFSLIQKT